MRSYRDSHRSLGVGPHRAANDRYSAAAVRDREDRERWGEIDLARLHPLNRDEVLRLFESLDGSGVGALSPRERLFLDNMTLPRRG